MLSYVHVSGDFNPRRVTTVGVYGGSTKKRPCVSHHGFLPQRTSLTHGRSFRSRQSPCPYKHLVSTPQHEVGGSKRHLTNLGGTTLQKVIDGVDQWTPFSCASKDSLLNTNFSLTEYAWVGEVNLVESSLGRLEIKIQMIGLEYLGINTWVGGSLSENGSGNEVCVMSASPTNKRWVKGYI